MIWWLDDGDDDDDGHDDDDVVGVDEDDHDDDGVVLVDDDDDVDVDVLSFFYACHLRVICLSLACRFSVTKPLAFGSETAA